ncbi:MAG TPA: selenoneine biosynthesis selenosugar synthase SenB [Burkholderiales bacterium]|nr:selenoneine biosynthesis selenosugar synthase SenB [Burkholderiales bacterium]
MRISIITPAAARVRNGNRNTAARWAAFLRELGHRVTIEQHWNGRPADFMIALHARRSFDSIRRYAHVYPERPLIVVLTGTDVYRDIRSDADAKRALELATRLVVLQEMAVKELTSALRRKARVIYQSSRTVARAPALSSCFEVIVSGHLREEKDPFRTAAALEYLPGSSRIRVTHVGRALSADAAAEACAWMEREPRYRWIGEVPHWRAMRLLGRARLMVISSRMEGGANVVSEALRLGVPVVASKVSGNIGMLGVPYAGYYPVGNERALARILSRAERDHEYYGLLKNACAARGPLVAPERERAALRALISECTAGDHVEPRGARSSPLLKTSLFS